MSARSQDEIEVLKLLRSANDSGGDLLSLAKLAGEIGKPANEIGSVCATLEDGSASRREF